MSISCFFKKTGKTLVAVDALDMETLQRIPNDTIVKATIIVPRSIKQHRLFFGILTLIRDSQEEPRLFATTDEVLDAIKEGLGYVEKRHHLDGSIWFKPKSIDFSTLDGAAFSEWFDSALHLITTKILPNVERKDFEKMLFNMLGERGAEYE
jgi:hypothetical protein